MSKQFYTYVHFVEQTRPFYVGKGVESRTVRFDRPDQPYYNRVVKKYGNPISIAIPAFCEEEALFLETALIDALKTLGYKLVNLTTGGDKGYKFSPDVYERISSKAKARCEANPEQAKERWLQFEASLPLVKILCECCGKEFETKFPDRTKYCSRQCNTRQHRWDRGTYKRQLHDQICIVCKGIFQTKLPHIALYCSERCKQYQQRKNKGMRSNLRTRDLDQETGNTNIVKKKLRVIKVREDGSRFHKNTKLKESICKCCGSKFETYRAVYCSNACNVKVFRQRKKANAND